jgi:hypothetical protein
MWYVFRLQIFMSKLIGMIHVQILVSTCLWLCNDVMSHWAISYSDIITELFHSDIITELFHTVILLVNNELGRMLKSFAMTWGHCATSQKVAGSIPNGVTGISHRHNPSGRTIVVNSASNRNEYQGYFLGGKGSRCVGLTTLPPSWADYLEIWEPQPLGTLRDCPGL